MAEDYQINVNEPWYRYRNILGVPSRKRIICGIIAICCILTLVVIAFTVLSKKNENLKLQSFTAFQSTLNFSIDPCVDFYDFTCGLWSQKNALSNLETRTTTFSILQNEIDELKQNIIRNTSESPQLPTAVNNIIHFYNLCVQQNESRPDDYVVLNEFMKQIGGCPISSMNEWNENEFDWLNATAFYSKYFRLNLVFDIKLYDTNSLIIKQGVFPDMHLEMLAVILMNMNNSNVESALSLINTAKRKVEKYLYEPEKESVSLSTSVAGLIEQIPDINWLQYFDFKYEDNIYLNSTVMIDDLGYLKRVGKVFNSDVFSKLELASLFASVLVLKIWILIPSVLDDYESLFFDIDPEVKTNTAISHCFIIANSLFPSGIDYLYIKHLPSYDRSSSEILTSYIKSSFHDLLHDSKWLDDDSKAAAIQRLDKMEKMIGFPDFFSSKIEFDKQFKDFPSVSRNLIESYIKINEYITQSEQNWYLPRSITDVSAYYLVQTNTIVFPLSLHNPPFFYENGPSYLNFGSVGAVLAHEMNHAFGVFDDMTLPTISTFTNSTLKVFKNLTYCFIEQYSKFDATGFYKNNGNLTLRENIADSEGLRIAFNAFKKYEADFRPESRIQLFSNYSPDQMFFISFGALWCSKYQPQFLRDSHSFPELRVNEAVSNLKSFALAFKCPENSPMNPAKKCSIW